MKKTILVLFAIVFLVFTTISTFAEEIALFDGVWVGKWVSSKGDWAPMKMLAQTNKSGGTVMFLMFQTVEPPVPSYSSMAIGELKNGKVAIDAASSGIAGGGTEMAFWLEGPMLLKGTYKNIHDEGRFEFRRSAGKGV